VTTPIVTGRRAAGIGPKPILDAGELRIDVSAAPDPERPRVLDAGCMTPETQWLRAVELALSAVTAATEAGAMPAAEAAACRRRLASERAWVQAFDWAMLDRSAGIDVTLLRRSRSQAAGPALRRAA
jgi:hypothetical protein